MSQSSSSANRILRTFVQLIAAGAFTALFTQIAQDVPAAYSVYVGLFSTLLLTIAQNYADDHGIRYPGSDGVLGRDTTPEA